MLEPTAARDAWRAIRAIARDLSELFESRLVHDSSRQFSLAGGDAGVATFLHDVSLAAGAEIPEAASARDAYLGRAVAALSTESMDASLYAGVSGIAWAIDHISRSPAERASLDPDALDSIDRALFDYIERRPNCDLDVVSGSLGVGVYFLDRLPREQARRAVTTLVDTLEERAERHGARVTWFTPATRLDADDRLKYPSGRYDLGVAHGVPGIVAFLARCVRESVASETAGELLTGAVSWLLGSCEPASNGSRFPYWIAPIGPIQATRLAWCYGDLGVSLALRDAAAAMSRRDWWTAAVALAENASSRTVDSAGIIDGGLCHGTAGAAHLFHHWFRATGLPRFLDASRYWFNETLALRTEGSGIGGYRSVIRDADLSDVWVDSPEFLNGAAGIGLALLSAVTEREPTWDHILLLSPSTQRPEGDVR